MNSRSSNGALFFLVKSSRYADVNDVTGMHGGHIRWINAPLMFRSNDLIRINDRRALVRWAPTVHRTLSVAQDAQHGSSNGKWIWPKAHLRELRYTWRIRVMESYYHSHSQKTSIKFDIWNWIRDLMLFAICTWSIIVTSNNRLLRGQSYYGI